MNLKDHWLAFVILLTITIVGLIGGIMITSNYNHDLAIDKQFNDLNTQVSLLELKLKGLKQDYGQVIINTKNLKVIEKGFITPTMQARRVLTLNKLITDVASLQVKCTR